MGDGMAKGYKQVKDLHEQAKKNRKVEWTSSRGVKVILRGIPPMLVASLEGVVEFPKKPTYKITTVAGDEEVYEHDETTLVSEEDKAAWKRYVVENMIAEQKLTEITLNTVLYEGVDIVDLSEQLVKWRKKRKIIGLPIPEDDDEASLAFKTTEVVGDEQDMEYILETVMRLSGVSESAIETASKSFQDKMESES